MALGDGAGDRVYPTTMIQWWGLKNGSFNAVHSVCKTGRGGGSDPKERCTENIWRTFCACVFFSKISPWLSLAKNESLHTNCTSHLICKVKLGQILHDLPSRHLPLKGDMPSSTDLPPGHDTGGGEGTQECPPSLQIWQRIWAEFIIIL